jgi:hypothetical protein
MIGRHGEGNLDRHHSQYTIQLAMTAQHINSIAGDQGSHQMRSK